MSSSFWLLAWPHPSLCYSVLYAVYLLKYLALHLYHFGWCLDCPLGHRVYPESLYCMEKCFHLLMQECLLRSVCCLHQFYSGFPRSVFVYGCHGLICVMALASQVSWVPWHQNLYLCENFGRDSDNVTIIIITKCFPGKKQNGQRKICRPANMALVSVPWAPGSDRVKSS